MAVHALNAPMGGSVKELLVAAGDPVAAGQEVLVLESMKMEIPVEAPASGTVAEIRVGIGEKIDEGQLLLAIED